MTATSAEARPYRTVLVWLVLATFTVILNETIMMNALPRLMEAFSVNERSVQWLSTAFMLTMAVVIPTTGWFLQKVSTRQAYTLAMVVFCIGTLLAALAPTFPVLVGARVVQAVGTAIMMPLLMTTLMVLVPANERGSVMGSVTLAMSVAPALGPTVSGVVLEFMSWRWIFWVVLPVAIAMLVLGRRSLPRSAPTGAGSLDVLSVMLAALGFGALVYGLSQLGGEGPHPVSPAVATAVGVVGVAIFALRQIQLQKGSGPLLDLRVLRSGRYTLCLAVMCAAFMGMLGVMILLPIYLQNVRDVSVLQTGLLMMPGGLAMGLLGPLVGKLFDRHGARVLVLPGCTVILLVLLGFTQITVTTPVWWILALHIALMVALAFAFTPVFTVGLSALPGHLYSHGSSMLGTGQQLAAAAGAAVVVNVMASRATSLAKGGENVLAATAGGMRFAFWLDAAICVVMVVLAAFLPGKESAGRPGHGHVPEPEPEMQTA
ncbi:MAG TPA: DHA2 family efflux MFS transporter permease subunit [Miltoncostaeales bacterium]|nr:DHA2 family efflux MFS transporter permease subunit [Miltoncostaeales bacterium]